MTDSFISNAVGQVEAVLNGSVRAPLVTAFFDEPTFTASYVVSDPATKRAALIDSVWNFDHASGRTNFKSADAIIAHVEAERLTVDWILETHAHATGTNRLSITSSDGRAVWAEMGGAVELQKTLIPFQVLGLCGAVLHLLIRGAFDPRIGATELRRKGCGARQAPRLSLGHVDDRPCSIAVSSRWRSQPDDRHWPGQVF